MPLAIPKILVVADPGEQHELVALLRGAGAPFTEAVIASGDGDDGTLAQFTDLRPAVVVVTASLAAGDARALIAAMREASPRGVFVVLLGDERGPFRNALDALDVGCDRFVARPVALKALRFAVMSGLGVAAGGTGRAETNSGRPAMISAAQVAGASFRPVGARTTEPMAAQRVTETMPVATRVTEEIPAVWGDEPEAPPARVTEPMAAVRTTESMAAVRTTEPMLAVRPSRLMTAVDAAVEAAVPAEADGAPTVPVRVMTEPLPVSAQRARWEAMADALGTGDGLGDAAPDDAAPQAAAVRTAEPADDAWRGLARSRPETGEIEVGIERTIHAEPPPSRPFPRLGRHTVEAIDDDSVDGPVDPISLSEGEAADASVDDAGDAFTDDISYDQPDDVIELHARSDRHDFAADLRTPLPPISPWRPGSTEVPILPRREPTLVISESEPLPTGLRPPSPVELIERRPDSVDGAGAWGSASQVPASDDDDDMLADVAAGVDEDLSIDLTRDGGRVVAPPPETPPTGGDFARELRRKMSAMAERLFRGSDVPAPPVAIGPGHDHHTEIDLGGLVDEPALGGGTEVFDLVGGGATFVGGDEPATNPQSTEIRGTAEAGEIQRGVSDAAALIARLFAGDFTGRILFRRGPVEKVIHVESGRPVFAASNLAHDRMGELLLREGKISAEQYARCRDLVRDTGRRMGEILVERGFLKRRELLPAVRRHVEDVIYSLFAWDHGEYRIIAGDGAAGERIRLSRHPAAMVLEGVRRKLDRATLERLVGPPSAVVETTDRDKLAAITGVADLSVEERAALVAFDGTADLVQVARTTGAGLTNVYQLAWGLHLLGLATTRRRAGDEDGDGDAPALVGESDLVIDRDRVRARHALVMDADYFALLGVRRDATGFEIKRAYEAARRDFAADTFPAELRRELAAELDDITQVLDEAYRVLRDDALRGNYVAHLRDFDEEVAS